MTDLERNKQNVTQFYELMYNRSRPREAAERFLGKWFTQHNPGLADGAAAFVRFYEQFALDHPSKHVTIRRVIAEGDLVVLHCYHKLASEVEWASIEIFRLDDDGQIVEHWDVVQRIPEKGANTNTMF